MPNGKESQRRRRAVAFVEPPGGWIDRELEECTFVDERLAKRFRTLLEQLSDGTGESIPMACQDWANTKAAYRFLSNARVNEGDILAGHFQATRDRFAATEGNVLVLQDTSEFSYQRENPELIGFTRRVKTVRKQGKGVYGDAQVSTVCGILMHSSLAVTTEGLPLGLAAIKFWTRKKFVGRHALNKPNPTRVPIEAKESIRWLENLRQSSALFGEPDRCIHVGDRESDIYELFCTAQELGTHFVVRACVDRLAGDGEHTITDEMDDVSIKGLHQIELRDKRGNTREAVLELKCKRIKVLPPIGKHMRYPPLMLTVIHAQERDAPEGSEAIDWKLITDLPVRSRAEAIEKLNWYALRWKIEEFHKIMKSGCKAEESKLRTAERLVNLIAAFCIMSWRIFWMTMLNRSTEEISPKFALTPLEIDLLDRLVEDKTTTIPRQKRLSHYLIKIAQLGGYLARAHDPPPGNVVMWRGLARLTDIELGFALASQ
ncbi:MAG: IS4 family transposase [Candidatus Udaeobacter sp.]